MKKQHPDAKTLTGKITLPLFQGKKGTGIRPAQQLCPGRGHSSKAEVAAQQLFKCDDHAGGLLSVGLFLRMNQV